MTLTEFLRERIAEEVGRVIPAARQPWPIPSDMRHEKEVTLHALALDMRCPTCHVGPGETCRAMVPPHHAPKPADGQHAQRYALARADYRRRYGTLAEWNQARVLEECRAREVIIRLHEGEHECSLPRWASGWGVVGCATLRALAMPYADHPDYRQEWRVS